MKRSRLLKGRRLFTLYAFYTSSAAHSKIKTIRDEESPAKRKQQFIKPNVSHTDRAELSCRILPVCDDIFNIPVHSI